MWTNDQIPAPLADDGELALADGVDVGSAVRDARPRAVEPAIAQRDALETFGPGDVLLELADRREHPARGLGRVGVERVVLGLHGAAGLRVRPAGEALGDEPADARRLGRGEQVVGALGPQAVGLGELLGELAEVADVREGRGLVDDHLGLRRRDRGFHGLAVEDVEDDRLGAEPRRSSSLPAERVVRRPRVLREASSGTRRLPTAPVPPAMKTFIVVSFPWFVL